MTGLAPGRIVLYTLSADDCRSIERKREGLDVSGEAVEEMQILPAQIIRVLDTSNGCCDLKVNLNGSDQFWAPSRYYTADRVTGTWCWPPRE